MTETDVRRTVTYILCCSHFTVVVLVTVIWIFRGFTFSEMTTTVSLLVPMFATSTTAAIKYVIANRKKRADTTDTEVSREFTRVSIALPVVFAAGLVALICLKAFNVAFESFDQFKILLALCESCFGIYLALIVAALYKK